jgi:hypothetical protein
MENVKGLIIRLLYMTTQIYRDKSITELNLEILHVRNIKFINCTELNQGLLNRLTATVKNLIFINCKDLRELTIPSSLKSIKCRDCSSLKTVTLTEAGELESITIENSPLLDSLIMDLNLKNLKAICFKNCKLNIEFLNEVPSLKLITIKECIIDTRAIDDDIIELNLENLRQLTKVDIDGYGNLNEIYLPESSTLEKVSIKNCNDITIFEWNPYDSLKLKTFLIDNCEELTSLILRNVTGIKEVTVIKCSKLEKVLFHTCTDLTSLDLSKLQLKKIECIDCTKLKNIELPPKTINNIDIKNSSIKKLELNHTENLETFKINGCDEMTELKLLSKLESDDKLNYLEITNCDSLRTIELFPYKKIKKLIEEHKRNVNCDQQVKNIIIKYIDNEEKVGKMLLQEAPYLKETTRIPGSVKNRNIGTLKVLPYDVLKHIRFFTGRLSGGKKKQTRKRNRQPFNKHNVY